MRMDTSVIDVLRVAMYASNGLLSEAEAAAVIFRSTRRLRAIVLESTGLSFREFRTRIKADCARELLSETQLSISTISAELGYSARDKLEKVFKKYFGMTPARYRDTIEKTPVGPEKRPLRV